MTAKLPDEVVKQLAPPPPPPHGVGDWFYTNSATLLVFLAAIVAAAIAWCGVQRQIAAEAQRLTDQIDAENKRQTRKDMVEALTDAAGLVHDVWANAFMNTDPHRTDKEKVASAAALQTHVATVKAKFDLLGMTDKRDAVEAYWNEADKTNNLGKLAALGLSREALVNRLTEPITD